MKIAWLGQNQQRRIPLCHYYHGMQEELGKIADVVYYGSKGGKFIPEFDIIKIVEKEEPNVIVFWSDQTKFYFRNIEKIKTPKFCKCSDPHPPNVARQIKFINEKNIDMVGLHFWNNIVDKYREGTKRKDCKFIHTPVAINTDWFKDLGFKRDLDIFFRGSCGPSFYPVRYKMVQELPKIFKNSIIGTRSTVDPITEKEWHEHLNEYITLLNRAKVTPFTNTVYAYAVKRNFEGRACNTLVMATKPWDADILHFVPDEDFVEINRDNYIKKIKYYLKNENERKEIAQKGYEVVRKYHTIPIRARQLLKQLGEIVD